MPWSVEEELPRVLVTRSAEDAPPLATAIGRAGYQPVVVPLIERQWHLDAVGHTASAAPEADWVLITSGPVVDVIAMAAPRAWAMARWAAVGPATAARLEPLGVTACVVPPRATAEDLVRTLGDMRGQRVVYPHGDLASPTTRDALLAAGADVTEVVAYSNVPPQHHEQRLAASLPVHATTLLSGSAAARLAHAVPSVSRGRLGPIVCIGPTTAKVAVRAGLDVAAVASTHSMQGLLAALRGVVPPLGALEP